MFTRNPSSHKVSPKHLIICIIPNGNEFETGEEIEEIVGTAIVKPTKKISYYDIPIIQISYLNCLDITIFLSAIYLLLRKYCNDELFNNAHFLLPVSDELEKIVNLQSVEYSDRFYLYSKFL